MPSKGQTIVRWGNDEVLEIFNCHTIKFNQELVKDDAGLNSLGTKFTFSAIGYIHDYTGFEQPHVDPVSSGMDATEIQRHARYLAARQRQRLVITVGAEEDGSGGTTLLEAKPFQKGTKFRNLSNFDLDNGPWCTQLDVKQVNANLMRCEFTFEAVVAECQSDSGNPNTSPILSNTWSCEDSLDRNFMLTRRWDGQLILATALVNPHSFRDFCLPYLQDGMARDSMTFRSDPSGKVLHYSIVDIESYFSPPPPAQSWAMPFKSTTSTGDGKICYAEASVGLSGSRYADTRLMLSIAAQLVESKILVLEDALRFKGKRLTSTIEHYAVSEEIGDKTSTVYVTARAMRPVVGKGYNSLLDDSFGKDPQELATLSGIGRNRVPLGELLSWDTKYHRGNWTSGATGPNGIDGDKLESEGAVRSVSALSSFLQTPCSTEHDIKNGEAADFGKPIKSNPIRIKAYKSEDVKPVQAFTSHVNDSHLSAMYTHWEMQSKYETSQHTAQMPIARFSSASPSSEYLPSSAFIALAPPETRRVIRARGKRIGREPDMPVPQSFRDPSTGIDFHLLYAEDRPASPGYRPGGDREYFREVEIVYGLSRAPRPGEKLLVGYNPFDSLGITDTVKPVAGIYTEGSPLV